MDFSQLFDLLDNNSKIQVHCKGHITYIFKKHQFPHIAYEELCNLEVVSLKIIEQCDEPCIDVEVID